MMHLPNVRAGTQKGDRMKNKNELTKKEKVVASLIIEGKSNSEIAALLFLSSETIKNRASVIYKKIGVDNRVQAVVKIMKTPELILDN